MNLKYSSLDQKKIFTRHFLNIRKCNYEKKKKENVTMSWNCQI